MVREIKAYKTTDNEVFESKEDALRHQKQLQFESGIRAFIGLSLHIDRDCEDVAYDLILNEGEHLYKLLKQFYGEGDGS